MLNHYEHNNVFARAFSKSTHTFSIGESSSNDIKLLSKLLDTNDDHVDDNNF